MLAGSDVELSPSPWEYGLELEFTMLCYYGLELEFTVLTTDALSQ